MDHVSGRTYYIELRKYSEANRIKDESRATGRPGKRWLELCEIRHKKSRHQRLKHDQIACSGREMW